jgi:hypothetical protein
MSVEHASTTRLPMRRRFCAYCGKRGNYYACAKHRDMAWLDPHRTFYQKVVLRKDGRG